VQKDIEQITTQAIEQEKRFHSITYGDLTFKEVIFRIGEFMHAEPQAVYELVFGTDSQVYAHHADFVSAIIVHRFGGGCVYFWQRQRHNGKKWVLRDRMYQEAVYSMQLAQHFMDQFQIEGIIHFNMEIHVDIGEKGDTREVIKEVVGMVRGSGFTVKTKPEAYGAASVADRYT